MRKPCVTSSMSTSPDHTISSRPGVERAQTLVRRGWGRLTANPSRVSIGEISLAFFVTLVVGFALYLTHIRHGSFYYDDWANAADTAYPPHHGWAGAISWYWKMFGFRPVVALYVPTLHEIVGLHEHWFIAWSVFLLCLMAATLYLVLRTLRLSPLQAITIAILAEVIPYADSTTLWGTASTAHLVMALYFLGLTLALWALRAESRRRSLILHAGSLLLYLLAVTTYELIATAALCSVLFYLWQAPWRRALLRFIADVVVVGGALVWTGSHTSIDEVSSASGGLTHAHLILTDGLHVIVSSVEPFGRAPFAVTLAIGAVVLAAGAAGWRWSADAATRHELRFWTLATIGGLLFAYVAWAVFVPSAIYYSPEPTFTLSNRTNALAVVGAVVVLFALAMIVGTLAFGRRRAPAALATGVAVVVAVAAAIGYIHTTRIDVSDYDSATVTQNEVVGALRRTVIAPANGAVIYAEGYPPYTPRFTPTFAATWDLNGAVKILYHNGTLRGYPVYAPGHLVCGATEIYPQGAGYTTAYGARYGTAYVVNVAGNVAFHPANQMQCDRDVKLATPAAS
jgi:hypothetical protein